MKQHWMVDVIADLGTYARRNGWSELAEQLDDTLMVAARILPPPQEGPRQDATLSTGELRRLAARPRGRH